MRFVFLSFVLSLLFSPTALFAQGLVTCHEAGSCSFCLLLAMISDIVEWGIIIATLFAILVIAYAGVLMIFSRGNAATIERGKQIFFQTLIGILIMLAGWTMVDTVFKVLVGGEFGAWNEITCGAGEFAVGNPAEYEISLEEYIIGVPEDATVVIGDVEATACDESELVWVNAFGHMVRVHMSVAGSLRNVHNAWAARGGDSFYQVRTIYGYSCRNVAGSSRRSYHSYGLAIDVNAGANPHRFDGVCTTDMNESRFYDLWKAEGWGWGCDWRSSKDAMHFSKARGEGGSMNVVR